MLKTSRRISIVVLIAACAPFLLLALLFDSLANQPASVSYYVRCGGNWSLWLLSCSLSAAIACAASSLSLIYTMLKRGSGHALNPISAKYAVFTGVCALAFGGLLFGVSRPPCWVQPAIFGLVALTAAGMAVQTTRDMSLLSAYPHFDFEPLKTESAEKIRELKANPDAEKAAELEAILRRIFDNLEEFKTYAGRRDGEAQ